MDGTGETKIEVWASSLLVDLGGGATDETIMVCAADFVDSTDGIAVETAKVEVSIEGCVTTLSCKHKNAQK